jgi:four helix bundle protein
MNIRDLEIYRLAKEISREGWIIYERLDWQTKKIMDNQFIKSTDSVGANIAEGFGRFHYLDRNKFNYNARGSLMELLHWLNLLYERKKISEDFYKKLDQKIRILSVKLNNYITSTKNQKIK